MEKIYLTIILIYTVAYAVTFIIQRSQIIKQKAYLDMFDLDRVKAYVQMNEETMIGNVKLHFLKFINNNKETLVTPRVDKKIAELKQSMMGRFQEQFDELASLIYSILLELPDEERQIFINKHLPKSKKIFKLSQMT